MYPNQEECWQIISTFFQEKGLVRQQLDSFDEFVQNTMQEIVDENASLVLSTPSQHTGAENDVTKQYIIQFGQVYLSRPNTKESDGSYLYTFPNEARLRNLTYTAPLFVDMKKEVREMRADGEWVVVESDSEWKKVLVASIPIMLRSEYCSLKIDKMDDAAMVAAGECPLDQGGYFIINGSEKVCSKNFNLQVLIAQERMSTNQVYVFQKHNSTYTFSAEIRSQPERGSKMPSQVFIKMLKKKAGV